MIAGRRGSQKLGTNFADINEYNNKLQSRDENGIQKIDLTELDKPDYDEIRDWYNENLKKEATYNEKANTRDNLYEKSNSSNSMKKRSITSLKKNSINNLNKLNRRDSTNMDGNLKISKEIT